MIVMHTSASLHIINVKHRWTHRCFVAQPAAGSICEMPTPIVDQHRCMHARGICGLCWLSKETHDQQRVAGSGSNWANDLERSQRLTRRNRYQNRPLHMGRVPLRIAVDAFVFLDAKRRGEAQGGFELSRPVQATRGVRATGTLETRSSILFIVG